MALALGIVAFTLIFTENRQVTLYICYDDLLKSTVRLYKQEPLQVEERGKVMQTAGWQQRRCPGHGSHAAQPPTLLTPSGSMLWALFILSPEWKGK